MDKNLQYTLSLKDLFSKKMKDAENATSSMDNKVSSLGSKLARFGAVVGIGALAKGIYDAGTNMDSLSVSLKTMLGNKAQADKLLSEMITFAKTTPFQQDEVATAGKQLLAFGIEADKIIPTMTALGDVSSGLAQPIGEMAYLFGTIKTQGKAMTVDIRQFANRGVPIYEELAKVTGKSGMALQKFIEDGKVGFPEIEKAFQNMSGKGGKFFNLMGELSKTTGGQMSNLKDQLIALAVTAFKILQPAINAVIKGLSALMGFVQRNISTITFLVKTTLLLVGAFYAYKAVMTAVAIYQGAQFLVSLISMTAGLAGTTVAQYALNTAMNLCPLLALVSLFALLIIQIKEYKSLTELTASSAQANINKGIADETKLVGDLAKSYEKYGFSKAEAQKRALDVSKKDLLAEISTMKSKLNNSNTTDSEKRILEQRMGTAQGRLQALTDGSIFSPKNSLTTNSSAKDLATSGGKSTQSSGTEISGTKPQSLVINITKLVEQLSVNTTNLKDSASAIKDAVSKALLEAVNDVNIIAR